MSGLTERAKAAERAAQGVRIYRIGIMAEERGGQVQAAGDVTLEEAQLGLAALQLELAKRQAALARQRPSAPPGAANVSFRPPRVA